MEAFLPELESDLVQMQRGELSIAKKSTEVDLVTQADVESERRLCGFLREQFPEDGLLAEEGSPTDEEEARVDGLRWILDPIDGTTNYAHGLPNWAISIGLLHGGTPVGGLVLGPALGERYRAMRGQGATRNGEPIRVNGFSRIQEGLVVTGFPYDRAKRAEPLSRALANVLGVAGGVRRLGAAALDFCVVADGRFIGYYEMALKPWDCAAGMLVAEEAGAMLTDLAGEPFDLFASTGVVVTNGKVHPALVEAVEPMLEAVAL